MTITETGKGQPRIDFAVGVSVSGNMQVETPQIVDKNSGIVQEIIARYEYEEDEFLRELEDMQTQASQRSSICDDVPVLGALCSLVGEIGELRRENRKLRNRLSVVVEPRRGVVHRVGALLDSRNGLLPKLMGRKLCPLEIRSGARERLSTPPHKDCLTASSYSADISSDFSESKKNRRRSCIPPLVLPEAFDSDVEQSTFSGEASTDCSNLSPTRGSRNMARRSQLSSISDNTHTSPSSASSRDPSETMTSSRSSFLELIGIRRRKDSNSVNKRENSPGKLAFKKRKRKASESDSIQSSDNAHRLADKWTILNVKSKNSTRELFEKGDEVKKSLLQEPKQYRLQRQKRTSRFNIESDDDIPLGYSRAQTCSIYTDSTEHLSTSRAESQIQQRCNNSQPSPDDDWVVLRHRNDNNETLRKELEMFKGRNNLLIDQLRQKSMENSKLSTQISNLQKQVNVFRNRCRLNEDIEKFTFDDRANLHSLKLLDSIEKSLQNFEQRLQAVKSEALNIQELAVNTAAQDQEAFQTSLEQVERLQRENFHLLQLRASELSFQERHIRHLLEMMPSYDALYSFTMGIVRKLGQLRTAFIEKNVHCTQSELEVIQTQISLLLAHAQVERVKLQSDKKTLKKPHRPISYHGENFREKLVHSQLNFFLPFELHGARAEKHRRSGTVNVETEVEKNEQNIESEFLRLFDYARCLSHICEEEGNLSQYTKRGLASISLQLRSREDPSFTKQGSPLGERGQLSRSSINRYSLRNRKSQSSGRPVSLVETEERQTPTGMKRFGEENQKKVDRHDDSLPNLNLNRVRTTTGVKAIVSSLQDVSNSVNRSPSSTPHTRRSVNSLAQIHRQASLDQYNTGSQQYGNAQENATYDLPTSKSSIRSNYNSKPVGTTYTSVEKKRGSVNVKLASPSASRLRKPNTSSPISSLYRDIPVPPRIVTTPSGSPPCCLNAEPREPRVMLQSRRSQDHIAVIHEESPSKSEISEKSRLPKLINLPVEKKKRISWLSRFTQGKK